MMRHILSGLAAEHDLSTWRALDLGCLEGHYTDILCEAGFNEVVAVDISEDQILRARFLLQELKGYTNVRIEQGSAEDAAFLTGLGKFNLILFHGLLYHLQDPVGTLSLLRNLAADPNVLLLSTQFKFNFAEVVSTSPIANLKFRKNEAGTDGLVRYSGYASAYKPAATRLNPAALFRLMQLNGYVGLLSYDSPLGSKYGLQLHLIAGTQDLKGLRDRLNVNHALPRFRVRKWNGSHIDGIDFTQNLNARISRFMLRATYSIIEKLGRASRSHIRRSEIAARHSNLK